MTAILKYNILANGFKDLKSVGPKSKRGHAVTAEGQEIAVLINESSVTVSSYRADKVLALGTLVRAPDHSPPHACTGCVCVAAC